MWLRPGLGMKERRLITVACVAFQDAPYPILSHVYAALKSREVSFDEMDELALHFAAHYGWPKGPTSRRSSASRRCASAPNGPPSPHDRLNSMRNSLRPRSRKVGS